MRRLLHGRKNLFLWLVLASGVLRPFPAFAWDDGGHMLVAYIAYQRLTPGVRGQADALIAHLKNPEVPTQRFNFVTAACWMDDIRRVEGYERMKSWHFINRTCDGHDPAPPHALSALAECEALLRDRSTPEAKRVEALASLLHLVGDVHQPLHSIDRDLGGNTYPISGVSDLWLGIAENGEAVTETNPAKYQRLHAYWDSAYRYGVVPGTNGEIRLLYGLGSATQPNEKRIQQVATALLRFLPSDAALRDEADASKWVGESNALACNFVFNTPRKQRPVPQYVERARDAAYRRLVLAGYRLGTLLNRVFTSQRAGDG